MHRTARTRTATAALVALLVLVAVGIAGWPGAAATENGDCEILRAGVLAQPIGAWTSLAFIALGVWAAGYRALRPPIAALFGAGFVAVGLGSFAGHAAATDWARGLDSLAIKAMLVPFVVVPLARRNTLSDRAAVALAVLAIGLLWLLELMVPDAGRPLLAAVAVTAVLATIMSGERTTLTTGAALLGTGAVLWWLGQSGGPLCDAESAFQMHGLWHILAASGFLAMFRGFNDH